MRAKAVYGCTVVLLIALLLAASCGPQPPAGDTAKTPNKGKEKVVATSLIDAGTVLSVTSPNIREGEPIPDRFSDYAGGAIPNLHWSPPPTGTRSLALIVEDPDAPSPEPFVHWLVYSLSATTTQVGPALPPDARQGTNSAGQAAYMGPRPPAGDPPHHYHFEVFALDTDLPLAPGADRTALVNAIQNHVLAKGELVATYEKK
jgi:Raf kinase inhibitor-like YbhB/YbcL family protein